MKTLGKVGKELELLPDARARADHKGREIAKALRKQRHTLAKFDVEVVDVKPIPQGVEVFARVWNKDGSQVGFGDGTIDIERFRFINPPILVPDGTKSQEFTPHGKEFDRDNYIEDAEKALLLALEHTVKVTPKHGQEMIVNGKRGSTTTTVYPDANVESTSVDGGLYCDSTLGFGTGDTWANLIASTDCQAGSVLPSGTGGYAYYALANGTSNKFFSVYRSMYLFDTSSIPDTDAVSAATFSVFSLTKGDDLAATPTLAVVGVTPASNTDLVTGDFDQFGTTEFVTRVAYSSLPDPASDAYVDMAVNAAGIAAISKVGITKYGIRNGQYDLDAVQPTWSSSVDYAFFCAWADTAGTTNDPKLVITHAASGPAPSRRSIIVS